MHTRYPLLFSKISAVAIGAVLAGLVPVGSARAQHGAANPEALTALVLQRFTSGTPAAFDSVYPDPAGRAVVKGAVEKQQMRRGDVGRVLWQTPQRAILLITGTARPAKASASTNLAYSFSGLYEAASSGGTWALVRQLPIDTLNFIHSHTLHVAITRGTGARVIDTLAVRVGSPAGLAMRLRDDAQFTGVRLNGHDVEHEFGGGILWVKVPQSDNAKLVLTYSLAEERELSRNRDANAESKADSEPPPSGAFFNSEGWHPYFDFSSANDLARFDVTATIPAEYQLSTTLPQTEAVQNGVRTVTGHSGHPEFATSILYDRDWRPSVTTVDGVRFATFLTPDFKLSNDSLVKAFDRIVRVFTARFGAPTPRYIGLAEVRRVGRGGLINRQADVIVSGRGATHIGSPDAPSFVLAHETSHGWTINATGPGSTFLREGWATYAEGTAIGAIYGASVERDFWERIRNGYMLGSNGRKSILGDPGYGSVHYSKGALIFHMLNNVMGDSAFDRGIREYVQLQIDGKPAGYEEMIAAMSHAAGRDMTAFVMPWLTEKILPDVNARVDGDKVIVKQDQETAPFTDLPVELALITANGTVRRTAHLTQCADTLDVSDLGAVSEIRIDPDHRMLLRRHRGEMVRFALPVAEAKGAKKVALSGMFSLTSIPATLDGDTWMVELPLSEGRYSWAWELDNTRHPQGEDGEPGLSGVRYVQPLQMLTDPYPR